MTATTTGGEQLHFTSGAQSVTFELPHFARATFGEPLLPEDIFALIEVMRAAIEREGHLFLLCDLSGVRELPAAVRTFTVKAVLPYDAVAIIGASFTIRVATTMIARAGRLLNPESVFPVEFFKTEREARAWLRELSGR